MHDSGSAAEVGGAASQSTTQLEPFAALDGAAVARVSTSSVGLLTAGDLSGPFGGDLTAFGMPAAPEVISLADLDEELRWQENALCAQTDPEAFFPEKGGSTREAKRVCTGCEVRNECLEYALAHDERFGIWGGLSERERRKLKKRAV